MVQNCCPKQTSKALHMKFNFTLKVATKHENDPFWNWNYASSVVRLCMIGAEHMRYKSQN